MIALASDHAGYELKNKIFDKLSQFGLTVYDFGTNSSDSVDYPDYAHRLTRSILDGESAFGILLCGTGNGICMTANKWRGIRAALCWNVEIAELSRQHNDANVLCLPARFINDELAIDIVLKFLDTEFEGGRHSKRVNKIDPNIRIFDNLL